VTAAPWPCRSAAPTASRRCTSNLNYTTGQTIANLSLAQTGAGGVDVYNASSGTVQVIADCLGYFSVR
jgi:hypothetical protein